MFQRISGVQKSILPTLSSTLNDMRINFPTFFEGGGGGAILKFLIGAMPRISKLMKAMPLSDREKFAAPLAQRK